MAINFAAGDTIGALLRKKRDRNSTVSELLEYLFFDKDARNFFEGIKPLTMDKFTNDYQLIDNFLLFQIHEVYDDGECWKLGNPPEYFIRRNYDQFVYRLITKNQ